MKRKLSISIIALGLIIGTNPMHASTTNVRVVRDDSGFVDYKVFSSNGVKYKFEDWKNGEKIKTVNYKNGRVTTKISYRNGVRSRVEKWVAGTKKSVVKYDLYNNVTDKYFYDDSGQVGVYEYWANGKKIATVCKGQYYKIVFEQGKQTITRYDANGKVGWKAKVNKNGYNWKSYSKPFKKTEMRDIKADAKLKIKNKNNL